MKESTDMAPYLSLTDQRRLRITLPAPRAQGAMGCALAALDDKILQNVKTNRSLESLASAIFKSWFVDFDPVTAKRDGKAPVGVPTEAIDLFPSHFEESQLGPIPLSWRVARIDEAFELNPRRTLPRDTVAPYVDMAAVPTAGHSPDTWIRRAAGSGMRFMNGDTLMARITPCLENGKTAFVDFLGAGEVGWGSTEFTVIRSKPPMPLVASYLLARNDDVRAFAIQGMTGSSGRQRVAADVLGGYMLALPADPRVLTTFGAMVEPLFEMARANAVESRTLAELRDTLLGPLLSGELTIKAAEKVVGEAV
jgi:type I restriction enzyme S subunit